MDLMIIAVTFLSGLFMLRFQLPPLIGFLGAGFALNAAGYTSTPMIQDFADLGVTLLLFTIGLKLDVKSLLKKEIWLGTSIYSLSITAIFTLCLLGFKSLGFSVFENLNLSNLALIGFALSFSSTVFAIKVLQEKGEMHATYATLSIGILIMQDIFAVVFLTITSGKMPGIEALILLTLPLFRPLLFKCLDRADHGEVLVLFGFFLALVMGAGLFNEVGIKADLGALILGMLMASHPRASEMAKSLFNLKELFLVCFFINIGLSEHPTVEGFLIALLLLLLLPLKGVLYGVIISAFNFRPRTALFTSVTLFNYSEFGLIVGGVAYKMGMMPGSVLVGIAIAVSLSFVIAAPLNSFSHQLYLFAAKRFDELKPEQIEIKNQPIDLADASILILGMGRIGSSAYDELIGDYPHKILSIEAREDTVKVHQEKGRNILHGDATDPDFWSQILSITHIEIILMAMPNSHANTTAIEEIKNMGYKGKIAAIVRYEDELTELESLGVNAVYNIYLEAGSGFARHVKEQLL